MTAMRNEIGFRYQGRRNPLVSDAAKGTPVDNGIRTSPGIYPCSVSRPHCAPLSHVRAGRPRAAGRTSAARAGVRVRAGAINRPDRARETGIVCGDLAPLDGPAVSYGPATKAVLPHLSPAPRHTPLEPT